MKKWQPWTITDGVLQLTEWPDHGPGVVAVEGDVFAAWDGLVLAGNGFPAWRAAGQPDEYQAFPGRTNWVFYGEGYRPLTHADILRDLFAHIDTHPATHYVLRTLHPERVRKVWPDLSPCRTDVCHRGDGITCPEDSCDRETGVLTERRRNVTLSLGPLATQPEADRLVPEMLPLAGLCGGLELYSVPTERIQFPLPCRESVFWGGFTRICVAGGEQPLHPDNVRCLRDQAVEAGVAFAFLGWGEWWPESQGCGQDSDEDCEAVWQCVCGETAYPLTDNVRCRCGDVYTEVWCRQLHVGSENSGNTLDGRTWPWVPTESGVADG